MTSDALAVWGAHHAIQLARIGQPAALSNKMPGRLPCSIEAANPIEMPCTRSSIAHAFPDGSHQSRPAPLEMSCDWTPEASQVPQIRRSTTGQTRRTVVEWNPACRTDVAGPTCPSSRYRYPGFCGWADGGSRYPLHSLPIYLPPTQSSWVSDSQEHLDAINIRSTVSGSSENGSLIGTSTTVLPMF